MVPEVKCDQVSKNFVFPNLTFELLSRITKFNQYLIYLIPSGRTSQGKKPKLQCQTNVVVVSG